MNRTRVMAASVALLALGLATGAANAQETTPANPTREQGGQRGQRRGQRPMPYQAAFKAIKPTAEQQTKFDALEKTLLADMQELRGLDPEERRSKMQEVSGKFEKDVEALLTPEQLPAYKEALKKERQRMQGGPMAQLETLKLTDDQKKKIQPLVTDAMAQVQKLMQDRSGDRQTIMQQVMGIMEDMKGKIRPILTPEQVKQFDTMQFGMGGRGGRRGQ